MTRLLNLRSIRAAIARGERRLAVLDGKRTELVRSIAELRDMLPQRFPLMSQETFRRKVLGETPDTHEQPQVELGEVRMHHPAQPGLPETVTLPVATIGDDLQAPQATDAEQASGTPGAAKAGWPKGLSKKLIPCPQSPIPHRHRVADPSKPTELTCVGITYPEKAAQESPIV